MTGREQRMVEMSRAVLDAVEAARAALPAINNALIVGDRNAVPTFGFEQLMAARRSLANLVNEQQGPAVEATRELTALGVSR